MSKYLGRYSVNYRLGWLKALGLNCVLFLWVMPLAAHWEVVEITEGQPYLWCEPLRPADPKTYSIEFTSKRCYSREYREVLSGFSDDTAEGVPEEEFQLPKAEQHSCFKAIWDLLTKAPQGYKSVKVNMAFFEDMSIAEQLTSLARETRAEDGSIVKTAVPVAIYLSTKSDNECGREVKDFFKGAKETGQYPHLSVKEKASDGSYGVYHPKTLEIVYEEADGSTYHYLLNGSYNFTPAAWSRNVEVMALLKCQENGGGHCLRQAAPGAPGIDAFDPNKLGWQVEHPALWCTPTNEGFKGKVDFNDTSSFGKEALGNACFKEIVGLLAKKDHPRYGGLESIKLKMGYFEDKAMARHLKNLSDQGVQVSVEADQSKLEKAPGNSSLKRTHEAIKSVKKTLVGMSTWRSPFDTGGIYHPKFLEVTYIKKVGKDKYRTTYILLGSYNFTVAAWRLNTETLTIIWKQEKIEESRQEGAPVSVPVEGDRGVEAGLDIGIDSTVTQAMQSLAIATSSVESNFTVAQQDNKGKGPSPEDVWLPMFSSGQSFDELSGYQPPFPLSRLLQAAAYHEAGKALLP